MAVLYPNLCYNEICYKGTVLYQYLMSWLTFFLFLESMMYQVLMLTWDVPKSSQSKEGWGQHFSHSQRKSKRYGKCSKMMNLFLVLFSIKCWLLLNGFICM